MRLRGCDGASLAPALSRRSSPKTFARRFAGLQWQRLAICPLHSLSNSRQKAGVWNRPGDDIEHANSTARRSSSGSALA
jgi:hypothetical protein